MEESAQTAAGRMHARNVGTLIVLDREQHPIGLITDRDLMVRVLAEGRDGATTPVADVMTSTVRTVRDNCSVELALEIMRQGPYRRLPVVDDQNKLIGVISVDDIIDLLAEEFRSIGELLKSENPAYLAR